MGEVTRTELNQQTARVLARVAAGERLTITDRGAPIAELSPVEHAPWDRLVAAGKVRVPSRAGALTIAPSVVDATAAQIVDDIRGERV